MSLSTLEAKRYSLEHDEQWDKYHNHMPFISLRSGYQFRVMPPHGGALMRFAIEYEGTSFSIYFDPFERLGIYGSPYYEVYPINDDVYRSEDINDIMMQIYVICEGHDIISQEYPEYFL